MKKRYFSFISFTMVFVMLILATGCGMKINGKDYELFTVNQKDRDNIFNGVGSESSSTVQISEGKQDAEQLVVSNSSGNIKIRKSASSQIEIKADKKVRGASSDDKKIILDNMNIQLKRNGKSIEVVLKTKDGNDFWEWKKSKFNAFQITVNFDISLPESLNEIKASTGAGNIDINDVAAKLALNTGAGNIDVQDISIMGDTSLHTGAGNIDFQGKIDDKSSFVASTGAGNIDFKVPADTKMSLKADTGIGALSGSFIKSISKNKFHFMEDINGGGPAVKLSTGVGNVKADED